MPTRLQRLRERTNGYTVTPEQYVRFAYAAPRRADADRAHRRGRAPDRLGPGLPDVAEVLRQRVSAAANARADRVLQPADHRARVDRRRLSPGWRRVRRRPYRRDLVWLGALLPLGVVAQAVLGGFTVKGALDYGWVMGHFALSMLILASGRCARVARGARATGVAVPPARGRGRWRERQTDARRRATRRSCARCAGCWRSAR